MSRSPREVRHPIWFCVIAVISCCALCAIPAAWLLAVALGYLLGSDIPDEVVDLVGYSIGLVVVLTFGYLPARILYARLRWRPVTAGHYCSHCSYDLTGNVSGRCPECGEATTRAPA